MKTPFAIIKMLLFGMATLFLMSCASQTNVRSTDLKIIRLGVESLTTPTEVDGTIKTRGEAVTNGDLFRLSGSQEKALDVSNAKQKAARDFMIKSLELLAEERAKKCRFYQFSCKRAARDIK